MVTEVKGSQLMNEDSTERSERGKPIYVPSLIRGYTPDNQLRHRLHRINPQGFPQPHRSSGARRA